MRPVCKKVCPAFCTAIAPIYCKTKTVKLVKPTAFHTSELLQSVFNKSPPTQEQPDMFEVMLLNNIITYDQVVKLNALTVIPGKYKHSIMSMSVKHAYVNKLPIKNNVFKWIIENKDNPKVRSFLKDLKKL